jgi:hypothetical protein
VAKVDSGTADVDAKVSGRDSHWQDYWGGYGANRSPSVDTREALAPIIDHITRYDALRRKLEKEGGTTRDVEEMTGILTERFAVQGSYYAKDVALSDQKSMHEFVRDVGRRDTHLQVRQLPSRMPVYYLCRVTQDTWSAYSLIVEDLYRSPGYPLADERFINLLHYGHETYYLRLSQFRAPVAGMLKEKATSPLEAAGRSQVHESTGLPGQSAISSPAPAAKSSDWAIDDVLYNVGRNVLEAAWHEDQFLASETARHFAMPHFARAIELVYLILSGELCDLRASVNDEMLYFFERIYPQYAIRAFLTTLTRLDGAALNALPARATKHYAALSRAFGSFLRTQVTWGHREARVPLYKIIYANVSRLALVAEQLPATPHLGDAAAELDALAEKIIEETISAR